MQYFNDLSFMKRDKYFLMFKKYSNLQYQITVYLSLKRKTYLVKLFKKLAYERIWVRRTSYTQLNKTFFHVFVNFVGFHVSLNFF